ncbi:uncharacterized protein STEHIDRAFT_111353 [Stereum hirsutum FP-91666 SS1]|uniref:uncharacterized protein n=1 Tax=Stereum hirsutum (strain FP-91666) TaxID=721885 RepID=UPI000444A167|nr:uncharacterized protein STEHIDRAFT_111353 [Stereum hirsutum FP-91666 SS1]EIM86967.1 hypothetical protein STEHIDRAFT_111353 [Stereum hirsutum FP-91666 SS1]
MHFECWCSDKGFTASMPKCAVMCFEATPRGKQLADHLILLYGDPIRWVEEYKYVRTIFYSTDADIFSHHFDYKARWVIWVANVTLPSESMMGTLPPREGRIIYLTRIDTAMIFGYKVASTITEANIAKLEKILKRNTWPNTLLNAPSSAVPATFPPIFPTPIPPLELVPLRNSPPFPFSFKAEPTSRVSWDALGASDGFGHLASFRVSDIESFRLVTTGGIGADGNVVDFGSVGVKTVDPGHVNDFGISERQTYPLLNEPHDTNKGINTSFVRFLQIHELRVWVAEVAKCICAKETARIAVTWCLRGTWQ